MRRSSVLVVDDEPAIRELLKLHLAHAGYDVRLGGLEVKVLKREDLIARIHD